MALPGWYSLSSVVGIHATVEGVAVLFFVALVVFDVLAHIDKKREILFERIALICFGVAVLAEVCAYPYSRRGDTLSTEASITTEEKIAELNKEAGKARKDAGEAIKRAATLEKDAAEARKVQAKLALASEAIHKDNLVDAKIRGRKAKTYRSSGEFIAAPISRPVLGHNRTIEIPGNERHPRTLAR